MTAGVSIVVVLMVLVGIQLVDILLGNEPWEEEDE